MIGSDEVRDEGEGRLAAGDSNGWGIVPARVLMAGLAAAEVAVWGVWVGSMSGLVHVLVSMEEDDITGASAGSIVGGGGRGGVDGGAIAV